MGIGKILFAIKAIIQIISPDQFFSWKIIGSHCFLLSIGEKPVKRKRSIFQSLTKNHNHEISSHSIRFYFIVLAV